MKANLFAAVLALFVVSLPIQSANSHLGKPVLKPEQKLAAQIELNKADAKALTNSIKGIGQKRAQAIVKYREDHGNFHSVEDLAKVKGLGRQFVKRHLNALKKVFKIN